MIKIKYFVFCVLFLFSCSSKNSESDLLNKENPIGYYGQKINLTELFNLKELFEYPNKYLGKEVMISGEILEVCPMRGCWINVKDKDNNLQIRVKVIDGKIVFPTSAIGHHVNVQGTFSKLDFTKEQAIKWRVHLAEEKGEILNPDSIKIIDSDLVEYRINGIGAYIYSL